MCDKERFGIEDSLREVVCLKKERKSTRLKYSFLPGHTVVAFSFINILLSIKLWSLPSRQRMVHLEEEVLRLIAEKDKVIGELEDEKKTRQTVERVLGEAASSLKDVLMV